MVASQTRPTTRSFGSTRTATSAKDRAPIGSRTGMSSAPGSSLGMVPGSGGAGDVSSHPTLSLVPRLPAARSAARRRRVVTIRDLRTMVRMYETEFASLKDVAEATGWSVPTAHRHLRLAGVTLRPACFHVRRHPRELATAELERTVAAYQSGLTLHGTAQALGIGESTVRYRLTRAGVSLRSTSEALRMSPLMARIAPEVELEIIRLYSDELLSQREVSEQLGVCRTTVRRVLRRRGVWIRDRAQAARLTYGKAPGPPVPRKLRFAEPEVVPSPINDEPQDGRVAWVSSLPLALAMERFVAGRSDGSPQCPARGLLCEEVGVDPSLMLQWSNGRRTRTRASTAERVLAAIDRMWWEVFDAEDHGQAVYDEARELWGDAD